MAIAEDRMSTQVVEATWLAPDDKDRLSNIEDYESGPISLNDPSAGNFYQEWILTWASGTGDFTATPQTFGPPVVVLNAASVTQLSFTFDQNAHINISYTAGGLPYLYWYDTQVAGWVTTALPTTVIQPILTLDDKRATQTNASDIILWWTEKQLDDSYSLFRAYQRDRFDPLDPKEMAQNVPQYLYKAGMHRGLRLQLGASNDLI